MEGFDAICDDRRIAFLSMEIYPQNPVLPLLLLMTLLLALQFIEKARALVATTSPFVAKEETDYGHPRQRYMHRRP